MSEFSADWLTLREPFDAHSRSADFAGRVRARLAKRPLYALDLGAGTGANIRYLAPRLGGEQHWQAVDHSSTLIQRQPTALNGPDFHCNVSSHALDLRTALDKLPLQRQQLVTASALLDLVSASWLDALAARCSTVAATVLFALTYDGRIKCSPPESDDEWLRQLVNQHQVSDKGFGTALGPGATSHAIAAFTAHSYVTFVTATDWVLEPDDRELQRDLIDGWVTAARELLPNETSRILDWRRRRLAHLDAGTSRLRVGHQDVVAWPA